MCKDSNSLCIPFLLPLIIVMVFDNQIANAETRDSAVRRHDGYIYPERKKRAEKNSVEKLFAP